jgi:PAS domain S-box-containing protein
MSESQINARASLPTTNPALDIFQGGGEVGGLMRARNWQATALGPPETWSHSLRSALQLLLNAGHPMSIWWGPDLMCFYNDAYRELLGAERHPTSLGRSAREVWGEIWNIVGPQIEQVLAGGGATRDENARLNITRNGRRADVYWTYSFSPIAEDGAVNGIGGVLMVCTETTGHVSAARRADEERQTLAELFEQASGFMALLRGPEHRIELANGGYLRLIGQRDVVGRTLTEALPDAIAARHAELLSTIYHGGEAYTAHGAKFALQNTAGGQAEERYADLVYQPVKDMTGAVTGILIEGSDVTARVLAEAALRESEARFREIADAASLLIWISDVTKTCTWFNEPWLRFTGRAMEKETGYGWVAGVHPDDIDRCVDVYNAAFDRQESYRTQYRRKRSDGEWRILDATGVPRFAGGMFVGYIGSCYDVTDQIVATRALSESEEQLRLATEAAEVGLWDWDLVNDTLYWPPRVKAMFGISAGAPSSMADYFGGLHPDDRERTFASFAAARDPAKRAIYDVEYRTIGKEDRIVRWIAAKGRALFDGDRCVRVIGTAIDITARKAAEQQLRELNEGLEQRVADALAERKVLVDIVESTDALIQVIDLNFRIMAINRARANEFERRYGVRPKVGDNLLDLLEDRPERREVVKEHWSQRSRERSLL